MKKQTYYLLMIIFTFVDIILLIYSSFYNTDPSVTSNVMRFDLILCIVLWIEFIYSYHLAEDKREYLRDNSLSILGMIPVNFLFLRALILVRFVQLIKIYFLLDDREQVVLNFLKRTYLDKIILVSFLFVFILTILVQILDSNINDVQTAFWYVAVSLTSTGYGDVVPDSVTGKLIGIITMIGGILIFSTFSGVFSSHYVSKVNKNTHDSLESKIDDLSAEIKKLNETIDELKKEKEEND